MTLFIFGGRSTALEVAELARILHPAISLVHVVGNDEEPVGEGGIRLSRLAEAVRQLSAPARGIITMAETRIRLQKMEAMAKAGLEPLTLINPAATVSPSAEVGAGCYIAAGARISTRVRIGNHCLINLNATVGHDSVAGAHLVVNPGAAISGNVRLGERVLVGANAFLGQSLTIGDDVQIDAMTQVTRDLPAGHLATSRTLRVVPRVDMKSQDMEEPNLN